MFPAGQGFPWAIFAVNVSGSFVLGLLMVYVLDVWPPRRFLRPFLAVGLIGGYTTFSTYAGGVMGAQSDLEAARRQIADMLARQAGYSESIVTTPGPEDYWAPAATPEQLSPSYPAPVVNQAVQRAITALGYKPGQKAPANLYQVIRNAQLGG